MAFFTDKRDVMLKLFVFIFVTRTNNESIDLEDINRILLKFVYIF